MQIRPPDNICRAILAKDTLPTPSLSLPLSLSFSLSFSSFGIFVFSRNSFLPCYFSMVKPHGPFVAPQPTAMRVCDDSSFFAFNSFLLSYVGSRLDQALILEQ